MLGLYLRTSFCIGGFGIVFGVVVRLCVKFVVCLVISCYCLVNVCWGCQMLVALV